MKRSTLAGAGVVFSTLPLGVVLALALTAPAALPPLGDEVSDAVEAAGQSLAGGEDRATVFDRLAKVVAAHPNAAHIRLGKSLTADLAPSAKATPKLAGAGAVAADPVGHLRETRLPVTTLRATPQWWASRDAFVRTHPDDPAAVLLARDRAVIGEMVPLLGDRTPSRAFHQDSEGGLPRIPRVCDAALQLIEMHSGCVFAERGEIMHRLLSELPPADAEKIVKRVAEWWAEVKGKSRGDGVRAQLSRAEYYGQMRMAANLIHFAGTGDPADKETGLRVLRDLTKKWRGHHFGPPAAEELARHGDLSALDVFHDAWKPLVGTPYVFDGGTMHFLIKHGRRREWELLLAICRGQIENGQHIRNGELWVAMVTHWKYDENPMRLPFLGAALVCTKPAGKRTVEGQKGGQEYSIADLAAEYLQKQTGESFGYAPTGTAGERKAAIEKAAAWWEAEGKGKYTFEFVEKNLREKSAPKK